jgi:hypothetical protein
MVDMSAVENMSIKDLKAVSGLLGLSSLSNSIRRVTAASYEQFIEALYIDLSGIISIIQENPELRKGDGEDRLTIEIIGSLRAMGYDAGHEGKVGGHADILVRGRDNFLWIGEAKIHSSYDYLFQGFQQLCTRYSTGDTGQDCGGLIIYIRNKDSANVISEWRKRMPAYEIKGLYFSGCSTRPDFVFNTTHVHERAGVPFKVKHIGVSLYFEPKDHVK